MARTRSNPPTPIKALPREKIPVSTPDPEPQRLRLEGSQLFAYAKLGSEVEHATQRLNELGMVCLHQRGLDPASYIIDAEGFILRRDQVPGEPVETGPVESPSQESASPDQ